MPPATQAQPGILPHPDPAIAKIADFIGDPVRPADFPAHILRWRNDRAAADVGLDGLDDAAWIAHFGRFAPLPGNLPEPLALRYHGHQFGSYNPDLGDGRGFLFAQLRDTAGRLLDLGTKGSGQTPYSRFGDGRLTLKGAVRELLATEMLAALGVDTSRTVSIIETGEALHRGDEPSPTRSAVLVRLNHGHIRIGSFQRLAHIGDGPAMERLLRYCLIHYAHVAADDVAALSVDDAAARLVAFTADRCARTVAAMMVAGFVHGVLNTDNINITGECFDYGPWRFVPTWEPGFVAAYFDHSGLYAFGRQPQVVHWNVGQLAQALRLIAAPAALTAALDGFAPAYFAAFAERLCWRLGVTSAGAEADQRLAVAVQDFLLAGGGAIGQFYCDWAGGRHPAGDAGAAGAALRDALNGRSPTRGEWWHAAPAQTMTIDEVEALWAPIASDDDWQPLWAKIAAVRAMGTALAG